MSIGMGLFSESKVIKFARGYSIADLFSCFLIANAVVLNSLFICEQQDYEIFNGKNGKISGWSRRCRGKKQIFFVTTD